jgi:type VI secretion system protein ImpH
MPAQLISLVGHWIKIPPDQRSWMGRHPETGQLCENRSLGVNCVVGARIWDRPMKFSVRLGPMTLRQFQQFQPGQPFHQQLHDWIAFYTRQQFFWEAAIVLKKEEAPKISLGQSGRLGYTTWLSSVPFTRDPDDYRLRGGALDPAENT